MHLYNKVIINFLLRDICRNIFLRGRYLGIYLPLRNGFLLRNISALQIYISAYISQHLSIISIRNRSTGISQSKILLLPDCTDVLETTSATWWLQCVALCLASLNIHDVFSSWDYCLCSSLHVHGIFIENSLRMPGCLFLIAVYFLYHNLQEKPCKWQNNAQV